MLPRKLLAALAALRDRREVGLSLTIAAFVAAAGLGAALGRPGASAGAVALLAAAWIFGRYPAMLAAGVIVIALGSSSLVAVKDAGLVVRWLALLLLATVPLFERGFAPVRMRGAAPLAIALLTWAFLTTAWSAAPMTTVARTVAFALALWVGLAIAPAAIPDVQARRRLALYLAALGSAGAAVALGIGALGPVETGRPLGPLRGWLENSNTMGMWIAALLPTLFLLRRRTAILLGLPMMATVVWTQARSALFALGILGFVALAGKRPRLAARLAVAGVACILLAASGAAGSLFEGTALGKFQSPGGPVIAITGARSEAWDITLELTRRAPLEGLGFGSAERVWEIVGAQSRFTYFQGSNPNNAYLQVLMEAGLVGLALFLALIAVLVAGALRGWSDPSRRVLAASAAVLLLSGIVESLLVSSGGPFAILVWTGLGVAAAGLTQPVRPRAVAIAAGDALRRESPGARCVALALPIVVALVVVVGLAERYRVVMDRPSGLGSDTSDGLLDGKQREAVKRAATRIKVGDTYAVFVPPGAGDAMYRLTGGTDLYLPGRLPLDRPEQAEWLLVFGPPSAAQGLPVVSSHTLGADYTLFRLDQSEGQAGDGGPG